MSKINLNGDKIYTDSPDWIKSKKETTNSVNDDDKCFQQAATAGLNYEEIGKPPQRISKIKMRRLLEKV